MAKPSVHRRHATRNGLAPLPRHRAARRCEAHAAINAPLSLALATPIASPPALAQAADGSVTATLAGEHVAPARRALLGREGTLFVADVHLGKAAAFRAGGVGAARRDGNDLARLAALLARTGARRLVVLGDFLHAAADASPH
jgi:hypothetical protein